MIIIVRVVQKILKMIHFIIKKDFIVNHLEEDVLDMFEVISVLKIVRVGNF